MEFLDEGHVLYRSGEMDRRSLSMSTDFFPLGQSKRKSSKDNFPKKPPQGLQGLVNKNGKAAASTLSAEDLKNLFSYQEDTISDTYVSMCCPSDIWDDPTVIQQPTFKEQNGKPAEDDLANWAHHPELQTVKDEILRAAGEGIVSFVFSCDVEGKEIEPEDRASTSEGTHLKRHSVLGIGQRPPRPLGIKRAPLSLRCSNTVTSIIGRKTVIANIKRRKTDDPPTTETSSETSTDALE